jgi:hypothetical protein
MGDENTHYDQKKKQSEMMQIKKISGEGDIANLNKYTIYQINLAYKVLRVLKKHKNKKRRKKRISGK